MNRTLRKLQYHLMVDVGARALLRAQRIQGERKARRRKPRPDSLFAPPLPVVPLCPYELIRERNIANRNEQFFRQLGQHFNSNMSFLTAAMAAGEEEGGEQGWEGEGMDYE